MNIKINDYVLFDLSYKKFGKVTKIIDEDGFIEHNNGYCRRSLAEISLITNLDQLGYFKVKCENIEQRKIVQQILINNGFRFRNTISDQYSVELFLYINTFNYMITNYKNKEVFDLQTGHLVPVEFIYKFDNLKLIEAIPGVINNEDLDECAMNIYPKFIIPEHMIIRIYDKEHYPINFNLDKELEKVEKEHI
jgi:hypothetical protein